MHKWITFPHREGVCSSRRMLIFRKRLFMSVKRAEVVSSDLPHFHHQHAPTGWIEWEGDLRPRAFNFNLVEKAAQISPWAVPDLLFNNDCKKIRIGVSKKRWTFWCETLMVMNCFLFIRVKRICTVIMAI